MGIIHEYLYNIDIKDCFFDSLKEDYMGFEDWYKNNAENGKKAYVSYKDDGSVGAFLMLKLEDEDEDYSKFKIPFSKGKRLKVSTFKVSDTGKKIGEAFIKIIEDEALKNNIQEIYITIFSKQKDLIDFLMQYGFGFYTTKDTFKADGTKEEENVFVFRRNL